MSAPAETVVAPAPVEEVKSTETPAVEPTPAVVDAPKVEEAVAAPEAPKEEVKADVRVIYRRVTGR